MLKKIKCTTYDAMEKAAFLCDWREEEMRRIEEREAKEGRGEGKGMKNRRIERKAKKGRGEERK